MARQQPAERPSATDFRPWRRTCDRPATRRGTLWVEAGLLARGSLRQSCLPRANPSGVNGPPLAAYSCGGSSGFTPASLLAPRQAATRGTSTAHVLLVVCPLSRAHKDMFI